MAGIFKAYDIRGIVGEILTPELAYLVGRGLASELFNAGDEVVVSRDMRSSGIELSAALLHGLCEGGCAGIDAGLAATPMNYWLINRLGAAGGVSVTASHNGPAYNGFKVSGAGASPYAYDNGLNRVEQYVQNAGAEQRKPAPSQTPPAQRRDDLLPEYIDWMAQFLSPAALDRRLRIAVDAGNGMGGHFLPEFFRRLPSVEVVPLFWKLDGSFPNHEADPLKPENLAWVERAVRDSECDFGVALDGDADRCMFIDNEGCSISSDLTTALMAPPMLRRFPGQPIIYDLRSSHIVPEWIDRHGGKAIRGRVGHSFMKRLMRETNASFGGELSGHYYFMECHQTDSGLMALVQIINLLASEDQKLSSLVAPLRRYSATGEINYRVDDTARVIDQVEARYRDTAERTDRLDGLTVEMDDWWFNLRASNTEPLLRLNLEAAEASERDMRRSEVEELLGARPAESAH